nr:hypothetical protein [Micromonospora purpureochromogenes]
MTYRQLFDDLIGEPPVSTVDVDRVISGQRRARRLRIGGGMTAVAAVVAAVLVGTTVFTGKPHSAPAPAVTRPPAPAVSTLPGTPEDAARLRAAARTAFEREIPGLVWITGFGGKDRSEPLWANDWPPSSDDRDYYVFPVVTFRVDRKAVQVYIQIERDGTAGWATQPPCPVSGVAAENCVVSTGPSGERVRVRRDVTYFGPKWDKPYDRPVPGQVQEAEVLREDGSLVTVRTVGLAAGVTGEVLTRIAQDPALTLSDRPSVETAARGGRFNAPFAYSISDKGVETALGSALAEVSPTGRQYFWLSMGSSGSKPQMYGMGFIVHRGALAGEGEVVVERGAAELSCAGLGKLLASPHREHSHEGECVATVRSDGKRQLTVVSQSKGALTYSAFVQRPDGAFVEVRLNNRPAPNGDGTPRSAWAYGVPSGGATPPLTLDQVVALAAHPDLLNFLP